MRRWTILSEKPLRANKFRSSVKIRCRLPNGRTGTFYLRSTGRLACAPVLTRQKRIVLANQFRLGPNRVLGELPGGIVDRNETPRKAIIREVLEETGYRGRVHFLGKSFINAWVRGLRYHYLITDAVCIASPSLDDYEVSEPLLVSVKELKRRLKAGAMTD